MATNENKKQPIIAKAKIKSATAFIDWYNRNAEEYYDNKHIWANRLYEVYSDKTINIRVSEALDFTKSSRFLDFFSNLSSFLETYNISLDVLYLYTKEDVDIAFVKSGKDTFIIPRIFLEISFPEDYSGLTPTQILSLKKPNNRTDGSGLPILFQYQGLIMSRIQMCPLDQ